MGDKPRILVVDDEDVVLLSVRKALKKDGYEIDTVDSANNALTKMGENKYDVIITDLMMPGKDGMELLESCKERSPEVRVIMITGYATMATAMKAIRQGAFDFIAKPFTKAELSSAVSRAVRHGPMEMPKKNGVPKNAEPKTLVAAGNLFTLRGIVWVRIEKDGNARVGIEQKFLEDVGEVFSIELPEEGDHVSQGNPCARITAGDARVHALWSPLTGRVLKVNEALKTMPQHALDDPRGNGWLIIVDPTGIEMEIENLTLEEEAQA